MKSNILLSDGNLEENEMADCSCGDTDATVSWERSMPGRVSKNHSYRTRLGETGTQVTFMILIGIIGIDAAFGGTLVRQKGPKFAA